MFMTAAKWIAVLLIVYAATACLKDWGTHAVIDAQNVNETRTRMLDQ